MKRLTFLLGLGLVPALLSSCTSTKSSTPQAIGWSPPSLIAPNQDGQKVSLKERAGGPWAVVFFYPEADTPG